MAKLSMVPTMENGVNVGWQQVRIATLDARLHSLIQGDDEQSLHQARKTVRKIRMAAQLIDRALRDEYGRRFMDGT